MTLQHFHPVTKVPIEGTLLEAGVKLQEADCYASTDGTWQKCPTPGLVLRPGCETVWVRPCAEISLHAKGLLMNLAEYNFCLTERHWWIMIPSPRWKNDGRMDWKIVHPECIQELKDQGFLRPHPEDSSVYQLTQAGLAAGKKLFN